MKDIARELGVSVVTVSKVIRNHADIGEETRQRVLKRVKELNYQPNPAARALVTGKTYTAGLIVPDLVHPFFAEVAMGLSNALRRELKGLGIGVTYVAPRGAQTDATKAVADFTRSLGMPPADGVASIAAEVWSAVDRGTDGAYPRSRERFFVLVERLCPGLITRALTRQLKSGGGLRLIDEDADLLASAFGGTSPALKQH